MNGFRLVVALVPVAMLVGCAGDNVLFVTGTTLGVKAASQPAPTIAAGYDRIEGYIAPIYADGEVPPVVASIQKTGGSIDAGINQTYATGSAAIKLAGQADTHSEATVAVATTGTSASGMAQSAASASPVGSKRRTAFIGSATNIGLKVGYTTGSAGPIPETYSIGYDRVEYSLIPLTTIGNGVEVYPSVFMSIASDMSVNKTGTDKPGINVSQFIATGGAADAMINQQVSDAFAAAAANTTAQSVNPSAQTLGKADAQVQTSNLDAVMAYVAPGGVLDTTKLSDLFTKADPTCPNTLNPALKTQTTAASVKAMIETTQPPAKCLAAALPANS